MKLEDIQKAIEKDLNIDSTDLDTESLKTPNIHNKYLKLFNQERLRLSKLNTDMKKLYKNKWLYYSGKAEPEEYQENPFELKVLKKDINIFIDSDEDIIKLQNKIDYYKEKVDFLERILTQITHRNWHIRNAIMWRKFINGEMV